MTPRLPQVALLGHRRVLQLNLSAPLSAADDIGDDLALLAACNHTILSYGTFGQVQWTLAFLVLLSGGHTTYNLPFLAHEFGHFRPYSLFASFPNQRYKLNWWATLQAETPLTVENG